MIYVHNIYVALFYTAVYGTLISNNRINQFILAQTHTRTLTCTSYTNVYESAIQQYNGAPSGPHPKRVCVCACIPLSWRESAYPRRASDSWRPFELCVPVVCERLECSFTPEIPNASHIVCTPTATIAHCRGKWYVRYCQTRAKNTGKSCPRKLRTHLCQYVLC